MSDTFADKDRREEICRETKRAKTGKKGKGKKAFCPFCFPLPVKYGRCS